MEVIGLSKEERQSMEKLYGDLCKFSHVSEKYFEYHRVPDLVLDLETFDHVSELARQIMDLILYSMIRAISTHHDTEAFFESYSALFDVGSMHWMRSEKFPLTQRVLAQLT